MHYPLRMKLAPLVSIVLLLCFSVHAQTALPDDGEVRGGEVWRIIPDEKYIPTLYRFSSPTGNARHRLESNYSRDCGENSLRAGKSYRERLSAQSSATKLKRGAQPLIKEPVEFRVNGFQFFRDDYGGEVNGVYMRQAIFVTVNIRTPNK